MKFVLYNYVTQQTHECFKNIKEAICLNCTKLLTRFRKYEILYNEKRDLALNVFVQKNNK